MTEVKEEKEPVEDSSSIEKFPQLPQNIIQRRIERGKLKLKKGLNSSAIEDFERILKMDPKNAEAKNMLKRAKKKGG